MKVREIMISNPVCCTPETNLASVAALFQQHNCGALPIIDRDNRAIGFITDRDICIAIGTSDKRAAELTVGQVAPGKALTCQENTDIHDALACMQDNHVRRLIVTDDAGRVQGILSIDDIILNVQWSDTRKVDLSLTKVVRVLKRITYPVQPKVTSTAASSKITR